MMIITYCKNVLDSTKSGYLQEVKMIEDIDPFVIGRDATQPCAVILSQARLWHGKSLVKFLYRFRSAMSALTWLLKLLLFIIIIIEVF